MRRGRWRAGALRFTHALLLFASAAEVSHAAGWSFKRVGNFANPSTTTHSSVLGGLTRCCNDCARYDKCTSIIYSVKTLACNLLSSSSTDTISDNIQMLKVSIPDGGTNGAHSLHSHDTSAEAPCDANGDSGSEAVALTSSSHRVEQIVITEPISLLLATAGEALMAVGQSPFSGAPAVTAPTHRAHFIENSNPTFAWNVGKSSISADTARRATSIAGGTEVSTARQLYSADDVTGVLVTDGQPAIKSSRSGCCYPAIASEANWSAEDGKPSGSVASEGIWPSNADSDNQYLPSQLVTLRGGSPAFADPTTFGANPIPAFDAFADTTSAAHAAGTTSVIGEVASLHGVNPSSSTPSMSGAPGGKTAATPGAHANTTSAEPADTASAAAKTAAVLTSERVSSDVARATEAGASRISFSTASAIYTTPRSASSNNARTMDAAFVSIAATSNVPTPGTFLTSTIRASSPALTTSRTASITTAVTTTKSSSCSTGRKRKKKSLLGAIIYLGCASGLIT